MTSLESAYTREEMMTVAAARQFREGATCFVGVGLPSLAACLARACGIRMVLVYESGAIGAKPTVPPLSIADPELAETADFMVSLPEIFAYWVQGGRIDMAFLGAAQVDRFGNVNSTVIGEYARPKVRMPGAGGAPEIATNAGEVIVILRQSQKSFVPKLDFATTSGERVWKVVTDLGVWKKDAEARELKLVSRHPGVSLEEISAATDWPAKFAGPIEGTAPPSSRELALLRQLDNNGVDSRANRQVVGSPVS